MSYGVPVVGTSIAAEGMDIEHRVTGWVSDDAEEFAQGIVEFFEDDALWAGVSEAGRVHVERWLGSDVFEDRIKTLLSQTASKNVDLVGVVE